MRRKKLTERVEAMITPAWAVRLQAVANHPAVEEPFSALAFKIAVHPFFGKLTYVRVYSGHADSGAQLVNSTKGKKERIGR